MMTDKLNQAAASVSEWNAKIWRLREDIAKAEAALADSTRLRQQHVLAAALGDDAAKSRLAEVLQANRESERQLDDLKMALQLFQERLREAENTHRAVEVEHRKKEVERLARERVAAAAAIDQAFSDFAAAWSDYESLGHELLDLASQEPGANVMYLSETVDGVGRLVASLPARPFLAIRERFNFMPISTSKSLAASEAQYWHLPPAEEVKAA
jgi:chromosome segregation ATPase